MQVTIEQLIKCKIFTFEYSVQNNKMTITRISPLRTRREIYSFRLNTVDKMGVYQKADHEYRTYDQKIFACKSRTENAWYFTLKDFYGTTILVLNPNETILESIKPHIPKHLSFEVFVRGRK